MFSPAKTPARKRSGLAGETPDPPQKKTGQKQVEARFCPAYFWRISIQKLKLK
jgi:hypothetical protein